MEERSVLFKKNKRILVGNFEKVWNITTLPFIECSRVQDTGEYKSALGLGRFQVTHARQKWCQSDAFISH